MSSTKILIAALAVAALVGSFTGQAHAAYRVYVIRPAINNDPILDDEALPVECRDETVMKVMCARGEYEPASFLVQTDKTLKQVMVKVSPLKGAAGILPSKAVDVRIAQKLYNQVTWQCETFPLALVHDPGMMRIVEGMPKWVRDLNEDWGGMKWVREPPPADSPLKRVGWRSLAEYQAGWSKMNKLVKELVDTDTLQPADVARSQQFWLTVHVPKDAKSGTYRGRVTITAANAQAKALTLEVSVPTFDLLPPAFEYSVYYPTYLEREDMTDAVREKSVSKQQYLAECRNMSAHGCTNPCIYAGPEQDEAGNIVFTQLDRILDLREKAGMPKGVTLYLMDGAGTTLKEGELTEQQRQRNIEVARATVAWAKARGYKGALFMGADEFGGERLRAMSDSYASIRAGGSGIWVANQGDFVDIMPDIERVIISHPGAHIVNDSQQDVAPARDYLMNRLRLVKWEPALWLMPHHQRSIKAAHDRGNKVFSYFDPQGGQEVPEMHRRHRGMGMWKIGLDGTMTWAYFHIFQATARMNDPVAQDNGVPTGGQLACVIRGPEGPLDKLPWEGYREGYDDARYLATLQNAMAKAKAAGKHAELVARTQRWLDNLSIHADLDDWRSEMARRTEALLKP